MIKSLFLKIINKFLFLSIPTNEKYFKYLYKKFT